MVEDRCINSWHWFTIFLATPVMLDEHGLALVVGIEGDFGVRAMVPWDQRGSCRFVRRAIRGINLLKFLVVRHGHALEEEPCTSALPQFAR